MALLPSATMHFRGNNADRTLIMRTVGYYLPDDLAALAVACEPAFYLVGATIDAIRARPDACPLCTLGDDACPYSSAAWIHLHQKHAGDVDSHALGLAMLRELAALHARGA
jgi:hypothetical protein